MATCAVLQSLNNVKLGGLKKQPLDLGSFLAIVKEVIKWDTLNLEMDQDSLYA
jgi:hypothetical protein